MTITNTNGMSVNGRDIDKLRELGWRRRWFKDDESKRLGDMKDYRKNRYGLCSIDADDILVEDQDVILHGSGIMLELEKNK